MVAWILNFKIQLAVFALFAAEIQTRLSLGSSWAYAPNPQNI